MRLVAILVLLLVSSASLAEYDAEALGSPRRAIIEAQRLMDKGDARSAVELLADANKRYTSNATLLTTWGDALMATDRYGRAAQVYKQAQQLGNSPQLEQRLQQINEKLESDTRSLNVAVIKMQRNTDAGNYDTTIAIGDRAIAKFPNQDVLYKEKGQAQYKKGDLSQAEDTLRIALKINPLNREARQLVEDIRTTEQAQVSTEFAEWISIAKDKVGDFIVTFLALFAAFVVNSLVDPLVLRIKLNRARRLFEKGRYDEFTDLIEGLLDVENFAPLRANFRFMLRQKGYDEAREILNRYVNTLERLPTLLRILERENEKLLQEG